MARKLAVRSTRTGWTVDMDRIGYADGLTVDGVPVAFYCAENAAPVLVHVTESDEVAEVNSAPQTVADRPYGPARIVNGVETIRSAEYVAAPTHVKSNRCARFTAIVPIGTVRIADGSTVDVGGYLVVVVKNRDDSTNATGSKRGSIVGQKWFRTMAEAVAWKHAKPSR